MKRWFPILFFCLLIWTHPVSAQVSSTGNDTMYTVDDLTDLPDDNVGDGVCQTAVETCTLRAAIQEANVASTQTNIILPEGTYTLTRQGVLEDESLFGDLDLLSNITIEGATPETSIIRATHGDRVLHVLGGNILLKNLSIRDGNAGEFKGGGIWNQANLQLENVTIANNTAYEGAGVYNDGILIAIDGQMNNNDAPFDSNNTRYFDGGGLNNDGIAMVNGTTFSNNETTYGGAIFNRRTLQLQNCTLNLNYSHYGGGGEFII